MSFDDFESLLVVLNVLHVYAQVSVATYEHFFQFGVLSFESIYFFALEIEYQEADEERYDNGVL